MTPERTDFWNHLAHEGVVVSAVVLPEFLDAVCGKGADLPMPKPWQVQDLRTRWLRFAKDEAAQRLDFVDYVLERLLGHGSALRKRGAQELPPWARVTTAAGKTLAPDRLLLHGDRPALLVRCDTAASLGKNAGRRSAAEFLHLLRRTSCPVGLLTNGRQWRLVWAGPDQDAWTQWEAESWLGEGDAAPAVLRGFLAFLGTQALTALAGEDLPLHRAVRESRTRQGELSRRLGEQVRQAVEHLLARSKGTIPDDADLAALYQAATRLVMRLVVLFFAESERRGLLPRNDPHYDEAYGIEGLLAQLRRTRAECGEELLGERRSAWPRLLALFRLVHSGADLGTSTIRAYGGELFRPGDASSPDPILRELARLESHTADIKDREVLDLLESLKYTRMRVGQRGKQVAAPVDFGDLSTEYVGILYEGLLDYELRRVSAAEEAVIGLAPNKETYLMPFRRLREMPPKELRHLLDVLSKSKKPKAETTEEDDDTGQEADSDEAEAEAETAADSDAAAAAAPDPAAPAGGQAASQVRERVVAWSREAMRLWGRPESEAQRLVPTDAIFEPGEFYLVRWGGTRKGSGTFYTPPGLAEPTVRRILQPLCWQDDGRPRTPEDILGLRVLDPACGSGSFLVSALRYLTEAYVAALEARIAADPAGKFAFPSGRPAEGRPDEDLIAHEDDGTLTEKAQQRAKRYVAQRCLYGVDLNPLAVELCRVALWIETLAPELPFEFFSHHVRCGNALVGTWLDRIEDYPLAAWEREMGDGTKGERSKALKALRKDQVLPELRAHLEHELTTQAKGAVTADRVREAVQPALFTRKEAPPKRAVVEEAVQRLRELESIPPEQPEEREKCWLEVRDHPHLAALRRAYDRWCAVWFWTWKAGQRHGWPTPAPFHDSPERLDAAVAELRADPRLRFFHWELEFPEVFSREEARRGFDAVVGNPPWDIQKPNSQEFFSNEDPLYRSYGKQEAIAKQKEYFAREPEILERWLDYSAGFKAFSGWVSSVTEPFEGSLARGKEGEIYRQSWALLRARRERIAPPPHPFRFQGSADLNLYKLFLEQSWSLLREGGRMGMLVPSGIYTDKGATDLRTQFLDAGRWEWVYGFENRGKIFDIHRSFKFCPVIVVKDPARPTEAVSCAFMRHDMADWAAVDPPHIRVTKERILHFAPGTRSLMEFRSRRDIEICEKIYHGRPLLGDRIASGWQVEFATEFHMTNDSHLFTPRRELERLGLLRPGEDTSQQPVLDRLLAAGWVPLMQGKHIWQENDRFRGDHQHFLSTRNLPTYAGAYGLSWRKIARNTDSRTVIAAANSFLAGHNNNLWQAVFSDEADREASLTWMNSLTFDYLFRINMTATDVHKQTMLQLPWWPEAQREVLLSIRVTNGSLAKRDVGLWKWIGLSGAEAIHIMSQFPVAIRKDGNFFSDRQQDRQAKAVE